MPVIVLSGDSFISSRPRGKAYTLTVRKAASGGGEQAGQQGDEGGADEGNAAPRHQLLHALALGSGVVVAVALQKVDRAPHAQASAQSHNEGLQNGDRTVEKRHNLVLLKDRGRSICPARFVNGFEDTKGHLPPRTVSPSVECLPNLI